MPITDALPDMERELKFFSATNDNPQKLSCAQIRQFNELGLHLPLGRVHARGSRGQSPLFRRTHGRGQGQWAQQLFDQRLASPLPGHLRLVARAAHSRLRRRSPRPQPRQRYDPLLLQGAGRTKASRLASRRLVLAADPEQSGDRLAGYRRCGRGKRADDRHPRLACTRPDPL